MYRSKLTPQKTYPVLNSTRKRLNTFSTMTNYCHAAKTKFSMRPRQRQSAYWARCSQHKTTASNESMIYKHINDHGVKNETVRMKFYSITPAELASVVTIVIYNHSNCYSVRVHWRYTYGLNLDAMKYLETSAMWNGNYGLILDMDLKFSGVLNYYLRLL